MTLGLALSAGFLFAQSQRLAFVEEFTQASCGPCASANPAFNTLLAANTSKITSVKYQVSWPGTDPMNTQTAGEVANRVTYYAVSGVPDARLDGNVTSGSPGNVTQTNINSEYALPSPFTMKLDYWFNAANDSVFVNCDVTCTQNTTLTTPRLRIAMVEKTITFSSPPGSNGEKVFYNVFRKAYPDANGSAMATTWTVGQKKVVSFKAKIPTYIYSKPQIGFVAWVEDDATKNVKQSAFAGTPSTPLALPPVADFSTAMTASCDGIVKFKDLSALFPNSWGWNFGDGGASGVQNPTHKYSTSGTYAVSLNAGNANGTNLMIKTAYVTVNLSGSAPTGTNDNICSNGVANLAAAGGSGTLNWYDYNGNMVHTGTTYSPTVIGTTDFWVSEMTANTVKTDGENDNTIGAGSTYTAQATQGLIFDVTKSCTLQTVAVYASTAGSRTIQVLDGGGTVIKTATVNIPTGLSAVTLNFALDAGTGYTIQPSTLACNLYRNTAGAGYPYNTSGVVNITGNTAAVTTNYYFFYDWKVLQNPCSSPGVKVSAMDTCTSTGINDLTVTNSLVVFPNPSNGVFTTSFNTLKADNYSVKITNTLGQVVYEEELNNFNGTYSKEINIAAYGKGVYMLSISNSKNEDVKKVLTF